MKKSLKFCKKKNGFTLIELVITIAIVIILSVVSVPIYRSYIDKAEKSEAYALLGILISAQKAYYSEYGNFLRNHCSDGWTEYYPLLGIDARGNKYFTCFCPQGIGSNLKYDVRLGVNLGGWKHALCTDYNITQSVSFFEGWV